MIIEIRTIAVVDNTAELPYMNPSTLVKAILPWNYDGKNAAEERGFFFGSFTGGIRDEGRS
jgi:hypothetical protein